MSARVELWIAAWSEPIVLMEDIRCPRCEGCGDAIPQLPHTYGCPAERRSGATSTATEAVNPDDSGRGGTEEGTP